jgi:hypothetical protein
MMMPRSREEQVDDVLAKEAIRELALVYSIAADRNDIELMRQLYTEDALDNRGAPNGLAREHIDEIADLRQGISMVAHVVTNHLIWVHGDKAEGEVRNVSHHLIERDKAYVSLVVGGRYLDKYSRDARGVWRFAQRAVVVDFVTETAIQDPLPSLRYTKRLMVGKCDETDPIYGFFTDFKRGVRKL